VKEKIDPQLIAKARERRDRYLEQANDRLLIAPRGKYEVSRALASPVVEAKPLPLLKAG
jgi:hypothetical protein